MFAHHRRDRHGKPATGVNSDTKGPLVTVERAEKKGGEVREKPDREAPAVTSPRGARPRGSDASSDDYGSVVSFGRFYSDEEQANRRQQAQRSPPTWRRAVPTGEPGTARSAGEQQEGSRAAEEDAAPR